MRTDLTANQYESHDVFSLNSICLLRCACIMEELVVSCDIRTSSNDTYTNVQTAINICVIYFLLGLFVLMELHYAMLGKCISNIAFKCHSCTLMHAPKSIHLLESPRTMRLLFQRQKPFAIRRRNFPRSHVWLEGNCWHPSPFPMTQIKIVEESN